MMDFTKAFQRVGVILGAAIVFVGSLYKIVSLSAAQQMPDNVRSYYDQGALICGAFLVLAVAYGSYRASMTQRRRKLIIASAIFALGVALLFAFIAMSESWIRQTDSSCAEQVVVVTPSEVPPAVQRRLHLHGSWAVMLCEDREIVINPIREENGSRELALAAVLIAMTSAFALALTLILWAILLDRDKAAKNPRRRAAPAQPPAPAADGKPPAS